MATRYDTQIRVEEIGRHGQELIKKSKVLIIGAGGLGTPVATYLAASGIGTITVVDGDKIGISNLHRQWFYNESELERYKAEVLKQKLHVVNPETIINSVNKMLDADDAAQLISEHDIICDCTDNVKARLLIDSECHNNKKPLVYAAVVDWIGYLTILNYKKKVRLTDIFSESQLQDHIKNNCAINGIVNTTCGVLGAMQACEVLKIILCLKLSVDGAIMCVDTLENTQRLLKIK